MTKDQLIEAEGKRRWHECAATAWLSGTGQTRPALTTTDLPDTDLIARKHD